MKREQVDAGQESVWDYPRPPKIEDAGARIRVVVDDIMVADSVDAKRILETSHPPVYYLPPKDIRRELLRSTDHRSWCEWKGEARYYSIVTPNRMIENAGWYYPHPNARFAQIASFVAFYPSRVDACFVDDERVVAQEGDFYGGWITSKIVGPFKGGPGTFGW